VQSKCSLIVARRKNKFIAIDSIVEQLAIFDGNGIFCRRYTDV
jgi:hypothetical protein